MKLAFLFLGLVFITCSLWSQESADLFRAINREREAQNLTPLQSDANANSLAIAWAKRMADSGIMTHRSATNLKECLQRYGWTGLNENLHRSTKGASADFIVNSWMNSPPHRKNMLMPGLTRGGVGIAQGADGLVYAVFNGVK
jgi:uncharacterized protein YkwD